MKSKQKYQLVYKLGEDVNDIKKCECSMCTHPNATSGESFEKVFEIGDRIHDDIERNAIKQFIRELKWWMNGKQITKEKVREYLNRKKEEL